MYPFKNEDKENNDVNKLHCDVINHITKLLINISNDNEWVASKIEKEGILLQAVNAVFTVPKYSERQIGFDILLLSLSLVVNMTICSAANRLSLFNMKLKTFPLLTPSFLCSTTTIHWRETTKY